MLRRGGPRVGVVLAWRWRHMAAARVAECARLDICIDLEMNMFTHLFTAQYRGVGSMLGALELGHMLY